VVAAEDESLVARGGEQEREAVMIVVLRQADGLGEAVQKNGEQRAL
jgi:hypothetical protein